MTAPTIGSLFSGYGGLDLAVEHVLDARTAWTCDVDPAASGILAVRFPDAPNLGDITSVDWSTVPPVDVLTGGFPCQDVSHAGARRGLGPGTRTGLWARMADAIDHLRPSLVVAENVRGLLSAPADSDVEPCPWCMGGAGDGEPALRALGSVLADLAELGYDAAWHGLRAADVGAPHGRFRVFVLAWPTADADDRADDGERTRSGSPLRATPDTGSLGRFWARLVGDGRAAAERVEEGGHAGDEGGARTAADADDRGRRGTRAAGDAASAGGRRAVADRGAAAADASGDGRDERRARSARLVGGPDVAVCGAAVPDADGDGLERVGRVDALGCDADGRRRPDIPWGAYEPAIRRWERTLGRPAPAPTEPGRSGAQRLSPPFVEWMMGLPAGWVTDVPGLTRNDQLKALGNGVVPQQAAAALRVLLAWRPSDVGEPLGTRARQEAS